MLVSVRRQKYFSNYLVGLDESCLAFAETIVEQMTPEGPPRASAVEPDPFRDFEVPLDPTTERDNIQSEDM